MLPKIAVGTVIVLLVSSSGVAPAQQGSATSHAHSTVVFVETDPAPFALGGFSAHLRVRLASIDHWVFGVGTYGLDYPQLLVDVDTKNRDLGWQVRLRVAGALFADYFFRPDPEGFFLGGQVALQAFSASLNGETARFNNLLVMPRLGYLWRPFSAGFYVMPWLGVGATTVASGRRSAGPATYHVSPLVVFATVHVGWRF